MDPRLRGDDGGGLGERRQKRKRRGKLIAARAPQSLMLIA
jgi:hypothetical protein